MPSLLLGAGHSRAKKCALKSAPNWTLPLVTLDMGDNCGADIIWDLENRPLPFADGEFDELAAYDVLEHVGKLGDWRGWFDEMAEYHRILKPNGYFGIIVPIGDDAYADPGHTRFFGMNHFQMLSQSYYDDVLERGLPITDYRWYWKNNFDVVYIENIGGHHIGCMLRKTCK